MVVFVGWGVGSVLGTVVTARSHANVTTINMVRNRNIFFMVEFPFYSIIAIG
jgi:hypothetical protein